MADLSEVTDTLVSMVGGILYPTGASGDQVSPVAGVVVGIEAGWPSPQSLDQAIAAGFTTISVYPRPVERNTTRFPTDWQALQITPTTWTLAIEGQGIRVGGVAPNPYSPQNLAVTIAGHTYSVRAISGDTAATIAARLYAAIVVDVPVTVSSSLISAPNWATIGALVVGGFGTGIREVRRQVREFQIVIWAPSHAARVAVAKAIDPVLADTPRITLPDGMSARLTYVKTQENDFDQKQGIFRRDFYYSVEYATTRTEDQAVIVSAQVTPPTGYEIDYGFLTTEDGHPLIDENADWLAATILWPTAGPVDLTPLPL